MTKKDDEVKRQFWALVLSGENNCITIKDLYIKLTRQNVWRYTHGYWYVFRGMA